MQETWAQPADKVLSLMEKVSAKTEEEKEFQRAVWSLCQQLKGSGQQTRQFAPSSPSGERPFRSLDEGFAYDTL